MSRDAFEALLDSLVAGSGRPESADVTPVSRAAGARLRTPGGTAPKPPAATPAGRLIRGKRDLPLPTPPQQPPMVAPGANDRFLTMLGLIGRRTLAGGGTGTVIVAYDAILDREVAVKVSHPGDAHRDAVLAEARVTARLQHPGIVPIHRALIAGSSAILEFRLAPSMTLDTLLVDWLTDPACEWPAERRLRALATLASALAVAHREGIVHGDVHPANVAVGNGGEVYLLDWSNAALFATSPEVPVLHGNACFTAPERLRGGVASPAADVWALGALTWQMWTGRAVRPRRPHEELADYIARAVAAPPPALAEIASGAAPMEADVAAVCGACLATDPSERPTAEAANLALSVIVYTRAEQGRRRLEAERLMVVSRDALARFDELAHRLADERRVAAVQRAKVPGHAPVASKRPLWDAEERVLALTAERDANWVDAADAADRSLALEPGGKDAEAVLADLWWIRMEDAEARKERGLARVFERRVLHYDAGRYAHRLASPARVSVSTNAANALATLHRFVTRDRRLVAERVSEHTLPVENIALKAGSWLLTASAPGFESVSFPLSLSRLDHHRARITMFTARECGEGWVHIPAGPFRLGGDPKAREALDRCTPHLGDYFIRRYPVRCVEWLAFLDALPTHEAIRRVPAVSGIPGGGEWTKQSAGWSLPEGIDPEWPISGINAEDAAAYALWQSHAWGRRLHLPGEEQWEKAARGADGRAYPWGEGFDPTFALMRRSRAGAPAPGVVGAFEADRSVYGVADMAGGVREWTATALDEGQLVVRGGSWTDDADDLRCAVRSGLPARMRSPFVGFRLVTDDPAPDVWPPRGVPGRR